MPQNTWATSQQDSLLFCVFSLAYSTPSPTDTTLCAFKKKSIFFIHALIDLLIDLLLKYGKNN